VNVKTISVECEYAAQEPGVSEVLDVAEEFGGALGDKRRTRRARELGLALAQKPGDSLPKILDVAGLEGAYRLLSNDEVAWRALHEPHRNRTLERIAEGDDDRVLIVHDTTDMTVKQYWDDACRTNLVPVTNRSQGMLVHASMAVTASGLPLPLGTLAVQPYVHRIDVDKCDKATEEFWKSEGGLYENEHRRWFDAVERTEALVSPTGRKPIHVMDRDGDSYGLLWGMKSHGHDFVVRCDKERKLVHVEPMHIAGEIEVQLGERFPLRTARKTKAHPTRRARKAKLRLTGGRVQLHRTRKRNDATWSPNGWEGQPKTFELNLVCAEEVNTPEGDTGVQWLLLTTEPVDTAEQILQVVEWYRRRWLIEELFKALKTGCKLEERQLGSASGLLRMLALLLPVAWRLLRLRTIADDSPDAPWHAVLSPSEFQVLRAKTKSPKLGPDATVLECHLAIARLGGHLKRNGRPGWQTLQGGWRELQTLVEGARLILDVTLLP